MQEIQSTKIGPAGSWITLDLSELWAYRELLYFLTWRDVKIKYKQTAIGVAWAVLQPVITTLIFTVLFSTWARFDTGSIPYPMFALSALMIWLFTYNSITFASSSFVNNSNLVTKVYFPRIIVPLAATIAALFDLVFSILILAALYLYFGLRPGVTVLAAPLFIIAAFVLTAGLGMMFAALNIRFRDVKFALPFILQVWMLASPVFYPADMITGRWRLVFAANPLTGVIDGLRSALFAQPFHWDVIAVSSVSLVVITIVAVLIFKRMEDGFADII